MRGVCFALLLVAFAGTGCGPWLGDSETRSSADTREFGFISSADEKARTISFDAAEFLTGEAAIAAATADGKGQPGEPPPNDYYIRNPDKRLVTLHVSPDARIRGSVPVTLLRHRPPPCDGCTSFPVSVDEFFAAFSGNLRAGQGSYWVTTSGTEVIAIEEQYRP